MIILPQRPVDRLAIGSRFRISGYDLSIFQIRYFDDRDIHFSVVYKDGTVGYKEYRNERDDPKFWNSISIL